MSKELELQIAKLKETIAKLEKQIKGAHSLFSLMSSVNENENEIQEKLIECRLNLGILYKNNLQYNEALEQFKISYNYYNLPSSKLETVQNNHKSIEILDLQIECCKTNQEQKKNFSQSF